MKSSPRQHWWSSWPLSMKVVLAGIVTLIVFGLYRRCTEDSARATASDGQFAADGVASVQTVGKPGVPESALPNASPSSQERDKSAPATSIRTAPEVPSTLVDSHGR